MSESDALFGASSENEDTKPDPPQVGIESPTPPPLLAHREPSGQDDEDQETEYAKLVRERTELFLSSRRGGVHSLKSYRECKGYAGEPLAVCPTSGAHSNALALSGDGAVMLSAGSDGYLRRYDVYGTINGRSLLTVSLRHQYTEGFYKAGVLAAYYPNEEVGGDAPSPRKGKGKRRASESEEDVPQGKMPAAPVHSVVCHSQALWALAGSETGSINLIPLRHAIGGRSSVVHALRRHRGAVSVLSLTPGERGVISGGWDHLVLDWDLDTGQVVRQYPDHVGQVSSLSFRPFGPPGDQQTPKGTVSILSTATREDDHASDDDPMDLDKEDEIEAADDATTTNGMTGPPLATSSSLPNPATPEAGAAALEQPKANGLPRPTPIENGTGQSCDDGPSNTNGPSNNTNGLNDAIVSGNASGPRPEAKAGDDGDSDGDSLFGDSEEDADGEAESDDAPSQGPPTLQLPGQGPVLPGSIATPPPAAPMALPDSKEESSEDEPLAGPPSPRKSKSPPPPKEARERKLASLRGGEGFDADLSRFSSDVFLSATLAGQVLLWDRRVKPGAQGGVHAIPLPEKTPPWCQSACWSPYGDRIYVGRRNECVEEWDLRALSSSREWGPNVGLRASHRLPRGCGPVTAVHAMPNDRHIVTGTTDNVRFWDTRPEGKNAAFRIVAGHNGATVSSLALDPTSRFLCVGSGDRGWMGTSTESILVHEVVPLL